MAANSSSNGGDNPSSASAPLSFSASSPSAWWRHKDVADLTASAMAGLLGRLVCHPVDTLKSRFQSQAFQSYRSMSSVLRDTWRGEGARGLYRGFGIASVGAIPGVCSYLMTYQKAKTYFAENTKLSPFISHFFSGIIAEAVCCLWFVPIDVIKERLQVQSSILTKGTTVIEPRLEKLVYRGSFDAVKKIMGTEGLAGLYKGYLASVASFGPFSALYFVFFEFAKEKLRENRLRKRNSNNDNTTRSDRGHEKLSLADSLLASSVAGSLASFLTSPLDLAKLRLQIQATAAVSIQAMTTSAASSTASKSASVAGPTTSSNSRNFGAFVRMLREIYSTQGVRGLFRGSLARVLFHTPNTAITLTAFDQIKSRIDKFE